MRRGASSEILRPSFLDRLIERPRPGDQSSFSGIGVRELKRAVARDLEWLLNTRVWLPWSLEELEEAHASILSYGMPDLSVYSWAHPSDAQTIAEIIERTVRTFEPRLLSHSVKCSVSPSEGIADFSLRIRIEAVLHVEPITEPVAFDSGIDIEGGGLRIESFE
jgi:type VI secretion system protein ImpF